MATAKQAKPAPKAEPPKPKTPSVGYRCEMISASDAETVAAILNQLGAEGWELVALRQVDFARQLYIFKRQNA